MPINIQRLRRCLRSLMLLLIALLPCHEAAAQEHHRLTNLPHLYINTFTGEDVTSKETQILAKLWLVDEQDQEQFHDSVLIRGRGNATWNLQKKPYRIKFAKKTRLLGPERANAKKWTLLANHGDKSLIRNALASYIGDLCGQPFTPAAKFVDLTLNGNYLGTYQISDQIDVRKHRVDIEEGGFLMEADGFVDFTAGVTGFWTPNGVPVNIHYPDKDKINNQQLSSINEFVNLFEYRLLNLDFNSEEGYHHYVDSISLASWYIASEISANIDYLWSMYFYKVQDDQHLHFGPLWDNDIAFDNDRRMENDNHNPRRDLMVDIGFPNNGTILWINRMWQDQWFQKLILRHYVNLYNNHLETKLLNKIDSLSQLLEQSQQMNYQLWSIDQRTLSEVVLFSTYEEYIDDLRAFIRERLQALLEAFAQRQDDPVDINSLIDTSIRHIKADDSDFTQADYDIRVYDHAGREVHCSTSGNRVKIDQLPRGLYIIVWEHQGKRHSAKFVR